MNWHQRFFFLLIALLPTQLGYHFWPEWAGVLGRRVDYLAPTIYLTDILIFLIIVAWLVPRVIQIVRRNPKSKFLNPEQIQRIKIQMFQIKHLWVMAGVVFAAVNILVATNPMVAVYKWIKVMEFVFLGWYVVKTKPRFIAIITPLTIGVFYSSVLAIVQFFLQHSVGGALWWLGERTFGADTPGIARIALNWSLGFGHWDFGLKLRPYATFPHPNVLGGYLAALVPLLIYNLQIYKSTNLRINETTKKMMQWGLIMTIILGTIALLMTFSRSAVAVGMGGIGASIWYLVYRKKKHSMFSSILYTIPFILFFVVMAWSFSPKEESVVVRGQLNSAAIKLWQSSPLFGVGLGNFLVRLPEALPTRTIYFLQPVHNIYLLILAETGVVGLLLVTIFIWHSIKVLVFSIKEKTKGVSSNPDTIYFIPLLCILLLGFIDHYPLTLQQGQLLLTIIAGLSLTFLQVTK